MGDMTVEELKKKAVVLMVNQACKEWKSSKGSMPAKIHILQILEILRKTGHSGANQGEIKQ